MKSTYIEPASQTDTDRETQTDTDTDTDTDTERDRNSEAKEEEEETHNSPHSPISTSVPQNAFMLQFTPSAKP